MKKERNGHAVRALAAHWHAATHPEVRRALHAALLDALAPSRRQVVDVLAARPCTRRALEELTGVADVGMALCALQDLGLARQPGGRGAVWVAVPPEGV